MTGAAIAELEEIEPEGLDYDRAEILGQVRSNAGGVVTNNIIELVPTPADGELAAEHAHVVVASDADSGAKTLAIGFSDIHDGEAVVTVPGVLNTRNVMLLQGAVELGMRRLGIEHGVVDTDTATVAAHILESAGLDTKPSALSHAA